MTSRPSSAQTALGCFKYFHKLAMIFPFARRNLIAGSAHHENTSLCQWNSLQLLPKLLIQLPELGWVSCRGGGKTCLVSVSLCHLGPRAALCMPRISQRDPESLEHSFQILYLPLCPESHLVCCENNSVWDLVLPTRGALSLPNTQLYRDQPQPPTTPIVGSPNPDQSPHSFPGL